MNSLDFYKHYTDPIPDDLLLAVRERSCVALVGSGVTSRCLSKSRAPLPGWADLLRRLVEWSSEQRLVNANDLRDLNELIEASEFLMVAQELRERLGDDALSRFVAEVFDPDAIVPSRIHELLSVIPFRGYMTTNYDNLLERAYTRVRKRQLERLLPNTTTSLELLLERNPFLLKLHGDLEIPSSIILAHRDYLRLASDANYQSLLDRLFSTFTVLMVGYGLTDLDIIQSLDRLTYAGSSRSSETMRGWANSNFLPDRAT